MHHSGSHVGISKQRPHVRSVAGTAGRQRADDRCNQLLMIKDNEGRLPMGPSGGALLLCTVGTGEVFLGSAGPQVRET